MSRWHIDRHVEREEERLMTEYSAGMISQTEYNEEMRLLHEEARDAEEQMYWEEREDLDDRWGYR